MADAGWYPDPQDPQSLQYFDGQNWTGQRRPAAQPPTAPPPVPQPPAAPPTTVNPRWQDPGRAAQQPQWAGGQAPSVPPQHQPQAPWTPAPAPVPVPPAHQPWSGAAPAAGGWQQPGWPPQPEPRGRRKAPLIIAAVVVAAVVAGVLAFVLFKGDSGSSKPKLTWQGNEIANADATLTSAESSLADVVKTRHGASNANTRCYFVQPDSPDSGASKSDIEDSLRCGPVLFVDGDASEEYVAVALTGSVQDKKATLTAAAVDPGVTPAKLDQGVNLVRPDGEQPPAGNGGLSVPMPPPAPANVLTVDTLGSATAPKPLSGAEMIGLGTKVTLLAAGQVTRYGKDDDAHSAPPGQKLIAFQVSYGAGDVTGSESARAKVVVDSQSRAVPVSSGSDSWIILAAPAASQPQLVLEDGGIVQSLSLPDGKPGANNAQVLAREHRTGFLAASFKVPIRVSNSNGSVNVTLTARATQSFLNFWVPGHERMHASAGNKAILNVRLNYTDPGDPGTFGFDPALLSLVLPGGQVVPARNVAGKGHILNVFEVPADFTTGTLRISGSEKLGDVRITVTTPRQFTVTIPAG